MKTISIEEFLGILQGNSKHFVIENVIDLKASTAVTVPIPSGTTLEFKGGYFTNSGTLVEAINVNGVRVLPSMDVMFDPQKESVLTYYGIPTAGTTKWDTTNNKPLWSNGTAWVDEKGFTATATKGTTRPTGRHIVAYRDNEGNISSTQDETHTIPVYHGILDATRDIGFEFFDTNPNVMKPIYVKEIAADGTVTWVDALGNPTNTIYPKVIGTPTSGNLAKFNNKNIEDAGIAPTSQS